MKLSGLTKFWRSQFAVEERDFLPAALAIVETPPSPINRAFAAAISLLFVAAIAWVCAGSVDIVASATGKVVPAGHSKMVQAAETGVIRAINVRDGQFVKAGDVVVELDATTSEADVDRLKHELAAARLDRARLGAALLLQRHQPAELETPFDASNLQIEVQRQLLASQTAEQSAKLSAIAGQIAQKQAERATAVASVQKLQQTIPVLRERVDIRRKLFEKELGTKLHYLTELQDLVGQEQEMLVQQSRFGELESAIAALESTKLKTVAEYERWLFEEFLKSELKIAGLTQDIIKAEQRARLQRLTAPIDGVVQQLSVHSVGGVVTPAQTILVVVPLEEILEIEAVVSNRDIGFVRAGQEAVIKVDTFDFTRYGLLRGKVASVSHDAIARERALDRSAESRAGGEPAGLDGNRPQDLVYAARISIQPRQFVVDSGTARLSPGMAVMVEIKTGRRRVISYLLSPLAKYHQEVLRER